MRDDDEPDYKAWKDMSQEERLRALAEGRVPAHIREASKSSVQGVVQMLKGMVKGDRHALVLFEDEWERHYQAIRRLSIAMVYNREKKPPVIPLSLNIGMLSKEGQKFIPHKKHPPSDRWTQSFINLLRQTTTDEPLDVWVHRVLTLKPPRIVQPKKPTGTGVVTIKPPRRRKQQVLSETGVVPGVGDDKERVWAFTTDLMYTKHVPPNFNFMQYVNTVFEQQFDYDSPHYSGTLADGRRFTADLIDEADSRYVAVEVYVR